MGLPAGEAYAPRARVTYTPTHGPARRAVVVVKVKDVSAYRIRTSDGRRIVVPATQLKGD